ncbi:MAG: ATP-binding cassette domain-containing protein [Actinomycetota bacterium]
MAIQALTEVSLSILPGQSMGVIGESGAGKTTLAALAAGLATPSSGRVLINGQRLSSGGRDRRVRARIVQLVWQDTYGSVDPRMTVEKIIAEPLRIHGIYKEQGIGQQTGRLLNEVGLSNDLLARHPHQLSGGEVQRVVIARALALDPELLICDEPAAALDARTKLQVAELLIGLQSARNLSLMVIAHDLPLVRKITGDLIVMYRGVVVESGPTASVIDRPQHPYTQLLVSCDPFLKMAGALPASHQ